MLKTITELVLTVVLGFIPVLAFIILAAEYKYRKADRRNHD